MGFPPLGSTFATLPFGRTVASRRTWPSKWPFFRIEGYSGSTIVRTLRWVFAEFCAARRAVGKAIRHKDNVSVANASFPILLKVRIGQERISGTRQPQQAELRLGEVSFG